MYTRTAVVFHCTTDHYQVYGFIGCLYHCSLKIEQANLIELGHFCRDLWCTHYDWLPCTVVQSNIYQSVYTCTVEPGVSGGLESKLTPTNES
jgi:hypothetical protein